MATTRKKNNNRCPIGIEWSVLEVGKPKRYKGTRDGAKANAYRANRRYPELRFCSFTYNKKVYILRTK